MISSRYNYSPNPEVRLNTVQLEYRKRFEDKVASGEYVYQKVPCAVCDGYDFEVLAEKDKHGLKITTVVCRQCGLIQTNPRMTKDTAAAFYKDEFRDIYEGGEVLRDDTFRNQYKFGRTTELLLSAKTGVKSWKGKTIVEIGCGTGGTLKYFQDRGCIVYGAEFDPDCVRHARSNGVDVEQGEISSIFGKGVSADVVMYSHVLEHVFDPREELEFVRKILKPDGVVYTTFPGVRALKHTFQHDFMLMLQNAHNHYFTATTVRNLAKKAGYKTLYVDDEIRAVLQPHIYNQNDKSEFINDYPGIVDFLRWVERERLNLQSHQSIKRKTRKVIMRVLRILRLHGFLQKLYYKFRY
ncbi:MAG: class I SAM-dependent methyltransferase [Candidatus Yanofskybacteria bacterium]|nr:class I SAM-dependent methyltransferase [Candidatus Yanofskybacteria bacterium]